MADARDEMEQIRAAIEQADAELIAALDARARAVRDFVALRERDPHGDHVLPTSAEVIARLRELRRDFPEQGLEPVLREVLGACAQMIAPGQVAVVGPEGGFAHLAARRWFGARTEIRVAPTVRDAFEAIEGGHVPHAVVPFETSSDGALSATLAALTDTSAKVVGELSLPNSYHLFSCTGNAADVERIYGAAATLAACERTLRAEFPRAALLDVRSGVVAAQLALDDHGAAALGSELLAEMAAAPDGGQTLRIVRRDVEDDRDVHTRFVVLGRQQPQRTGSDRTMMLLVLSGEPGSLYAALQPFAERGINVTRLESRRVRGAAWQDVVFVELNGHVSDRSLLTAIDEVKARARHVKVVGSYPRPA
jgi:chorismate mutase/prephenate dehydratase